jgi:hypothetical protein
MVLHPTPLWFPGARLKAPSRARNWLRQIFDSWLLQVIGLKSMNISIDFSKEKQRQSLSCMLPIRPDPYNAM